MKGDRTMVTLSKTELSWIWDIVGKEAEICDRHAETSDNAAERALYDLRAQNLYAVAAKLLAASDNKRIAIK